MMTLSPKCISHVIRIAPEKQIDPFVKEENEKVKCYVGNPSLKAMWDAPDARDREFEAQLARNRKHTSTQDYSEDDNCDDEDVLVSSDDTCKAVETAYNNGESLPTQRFLSMLSHLPTMENLFPTKQQLLLYKNSLLTLVLYV